jgi:hypothetical protein
LPPIIDQVDNDNKEQTEQSVHIESFTINYGDTFPPQSRKRIQGAKENQPIDAKHVKIEVGELVQNI